jgi:hypothetical protein
MKRRSRVFVGYHRLGVVLALPFLAAAIVLAGQQLKYPTGPMVE